MQCPSATAAVNNRRHALMPAARATRHCQSKPHFKCHTNNGCVFLQLVIWQNRALLVSDRFDRRSISACSTKSLSPFRFGSALNTAHIPDDDKATQHGESSCTGRSVDPEKTFAAPHKRHITSVFSPVSVCWSVNRITPKLLEWLDTIQGPMD